MARRSAPFARIALDYPDHPKIAGLSDAAFRAHVEMILYARKYKTDGLIPRRIAKRFASAALSELLTNDDDRPSLTQDGDGDYWLHDFSAWQETREEIDAKSQVNKVAGTKGAQKRWRNAKRNDSDSPSKTDSESIAEIETEEETEEVPKGTSRAATRGRRLDPSWTPDDSDREYAVAHGIAPAAEAENFRDYWLNKPGRDGLKLDWSLAWKTWIRKAAERAPRNLHAVGSSQSLKSIYQDF